VDLFDLRNSFDKAESTERWVLSAPPHLFRLRTFQEFLERLGRRRESSELIVCNSIERIALDLQLLRKNRGDNL
jgi:hypothetical protein